MIDKKMTAILVIILVLVFSTISLSIGGQSIINDGVSSISSQFTVSSGLHPIVDAIQYCPYC
jgi:hypothetical protein